MKKYLHIFCLIFFIFFTKNVYANENNKIVFIDVEYLINNSIIGKRTLKNLEPGCRRPVQHGAKSCVHRPQFQLKDKSNVRTCTSSATQNSLVLNVWTKVHINECLKATGKRPVKGRWVDINKGDEQHPNYRSRYVGREFKSGDHRDDLFAATPPIEAIKTLVSLAASQKGCKHIKKLSGTYNGQNFC